MDLAAHTASMTRLMWIAGIGLGAHLGVIIIRRLARRLIFTRLGSEAKAQTVTGFVQSLLVFILYFGAFGFALDELGVPLTTYLAGASVIGLAVSFGSQGVVQDVITGLTVVFSDLLDVGDLANVGGQVGIVQSIGMRFTALIGFSGERVFVPNRTIANVINYPHGTIRAYVDARVPTVDERNRVQATEAFSKAAHAADEQYRGVLLVAPTVEGYRKTAAGYGYVRSWVPPTSPWPSTASNTISRAPRTHASRCRATRSFPGAAIARLYAESREKRWAHFVDSRSSSWRFLRIPHR